MNAPAERPVVKTTCPYCGVGCGVLAKPDGFGGADITGDTAHPANFGRLCSKGSALGETLSLDGRLLFPSYRAADGTLTRTSWTAALQRVAEGFRNTIERHGPDAVAFYVSGQLLTEDYYVANKLMKGFIGSANIDTNSRLCMASSVAGHKRAFGSDTVPGCYEDLDGADLLVLTGSNAAWCHPVLYQRMVKNRAERGAKIVVIDPRQTATAEDADLVLTIEPGTDAILFSGLFSHLAAVGTLNRAFVANHTHGYSEALVRARRLAPDIETVAARCGLSLEDVATFYTWFQTTEKTVTLYSQGVNQSAQGTDKVNAIINCHLATGRIGQPAMGPFSLTGQPNAMGGREVGGLANQLAAHMGFDPDDRDRVQRFWNSPVIASKDGLKAVELFDQIATGRIKALWVMATNPVVSLPRADAVGAALKKLDLLVVSDVVERTDTIGAGAQVLLPAAAWGEKDGTVTNSERRISRQRKFMPAPGEARPDWWIICETAKRMGFETAFSFNSVSEIFAEHASLSAFENDGTRDFDIGGLASLTALQYQALEPVQWPVRSPGGTGKARLFASGPFYTRDQRAGFVAVADPSLAVSCSTLFPLLLNTGRIRDQWHTMTRTGKSPRLSAHFEEPFLEINPADAIPLQILDGSLVRVTSLHGQAVLRTRFNPGVPRDTVFAPIHWTAQNSSAARVGALVQPAVDPYSGQPELKATPVAVSPVRFAYEGFAVSRSPQSLDGLTYWAQVTITGGTGVRLACDEDPCGIVHRFTGLVGGSAEFLEFSDEMRGVYRAAVLADGKLQACWFFSRDAWALPDWAWIKTLLASESLDAATRRSLLAAEAPSGQGQSGPIVCACFGVGESSIKCLVEKGDATTLEAVGLACKAGTNCGSCKPEIKRLIAHTKRLSAELVS
jgi:assimilatory nitrate reductase catalytic subunit